MLSRLLADLDRDDVSGQVAESVREVERVKKAPNQEPGGWFEFIEWAKRISDESDFLKDEREYKLRIVAGLRTAKAALEEGKADWLASLRRAFSGPNNLTPWNMHDRFLKWCESGFSDGERPSPSHLERRLQPNAPARCICGISP